MTNPTDRAAVHTLDDLISEAYAATGVLPTIDNCRRINDGLRQAIGELAKQVQHLKAMQPVRSRDWYRCDKLLDGTTHLLACDMGSGLLSAAMHVAELGRHCQMLRDCIRETQ